MPVLILTSFNGQIHTAIDHADVPNRLRAVLGTELQRVPLTHLQAELSLDVLLPLLRVLGKLK